MNPTLSRAEVERLEVALGSAKTTGGSTHNFYLYPARFSPEIARTVIQLFSEPRDWVLDPFMGGGTTVIEGLALGRSMVGVDLNALAHFVTCVRTRPLSHQDEESIRAWAARAAIFRRPQGPELLPHVANLPASLTRLMSRALSAVEGLRFPRQRAFARTVLLRLGQWALDCRDHISLSRRQVGERLLELTDEMLAGLQEFVDLCRSAGVPKKQIPNRRLLLCRSAARLHEDPRLSGLTDRPRLVFTSPPYPRVHVLYHRWQVRGRKETPAPYWIAQVQDGKNASHYTGGSRTPTGERSYFSMITEVFSSVREILAADGIVVQLVGFADLRSQLPMYLAAMSAAGFETLAPAGSHELQLWRRVPNRKWYAKLQAAVDASSEILLFHRPRRRGCSW